MDIRHFTTESYPRQQRPHAWRDALAGCKLRCQAIADDSALHGSVYASTLGSGLEFIRVASCAQTLSNMDGSAGVVWLALQLQGDAVFNDGNSSMPLAAGDIAHGPAGTHLLMTQAGDFRQLLVRVPRPLLESRLPAPLPARAGQLSGRSGIGRVFANFLGSIADSLETLDAGQMLPIELALTEFIAATLCVQEPDGSAMSPGHSANFFRICQKIESSLSNPEASLALLARQERVSERYLQKLFESTGRTFSTYIRQRRLERCRADLINPLYARLSISDICFRWGFNDAAHFSHAFRDQYGVSPRNYRQESGAELSRQLLRQISRGWPLGFAEPAHKRGARAEATPSAGAAVALREPELADVRSAIEIPDHGADADGTARHHYLPANAHTIHWGFFSKSLAPVLEIDSGDIVTIETLTQHASDDHERMIQGDAGAESVFHWTRERKNVDRRGAGPADASIYGRGNGEGFGVHICTGPVYVRDAKPGDVLEVRILDVLPRLSANPKYPGRTFGSNAATWWGFHYNELLTEPKPREVVTIYELNCAHGDNCARAVYNFRWMPQRDPDGVLHSTIDYPGVPIDRDSIVENHGVLKNIKIPVRPHFGVIAVAPKEAEMVDSIPPSDFGGNLDNWRIAKGATVYLRVGVPGALFSVGDPHASQGDSELCGTAIECSLTGVFQIILHRKKDLTNQPYADLSYPLVETADEWVLHGFSHPSYLAELGDKAQSEIYKESSLDLAMRDAFRKTRRFLMSAKGLTEDEAISLMSVAVDFGVTQVVDGNWGVHAIIRKSLFEP
ncbi:MAG TPA: acetamidase/formamidase family protein [Burkholderiales bacterium]|nr:acetamidase/formamidase family protein [Burkholderiales bacterium]